jgi:hypothetical protein
VTYEERVEAMRRRAAEDQRRHEEALASTNHPGFFHSGNVGDGSMVTCRRCGEMFDCHEPDEATPHARVCRDQKSS